jgi:hypothetical protein
MGWEQIFLSHRWSFDPKQLVQTIAEHGRILQALLARNRKWLPRPWTSTWSMSPSTRLNLS